MRENELTMGEALKLSRQREALQEQWAATDYWRFVAISAICVAVIEADRDGDYGGSVGHWF